MNITDITLDYRIKPGKTSITVKDNKGKTKGIITNCKTFHNMPPREQFELHSKLKKAGVEKSLSVASSCVLKDGDVFYLYNQSLKKHIEKYGAFDESEQKRLDEMEDVSKMLKEHNIPVIECLFITKKAYRTISSCKESNINND